MTRSDPETESVLLLRTSRRDDAALAELYDRLGAAAYGLALRITRDAGLAQDAVQEGFLRVWNRADRFDRARGSPRAWLLQIVRNAAVDRLRSEGSLRRAESRSVHSGAPVEPANSAFDEVVAGEARSTARTALEGLSGEQKRALELAYFEGLSHSEIAEREGLALGTVKSRIRQGVGRLRSILGRSGDV